MNNSYSDHGKQVVSAAGTVVQVAQGIDAAGSPVVVLALKLAVNDGGADETAYLSLKRDNASMLYKSLGRVLQAMKKGES